MKDNPTLFVNGEIDIYTCSELREAFMALLAEDHTVIVLNLENVEYIDSTGLGTVAYAAQRLSEKNGKIIVVCKKPQIKKIFQVSGLLTKNIQLYETQEEVLETHEGIN